MGVIIYLFGVIGILATLLPLIRKSDWWIRIFDFPRVQILILIIASAAGYFLLTELNSLFKITFLSLLILSAVYQIIKILPYTFITKRQVKKTSKKNVSLSLLIVNVYMYNNNYKGLVKIIKENDPDILIMVESDKKWEEGISEIEELFAYYVFQPQENTYGMHMYSKLELVNPEIKFLIEKDVPSIHTKVKLRNGELVLLYSLHPTPPRPLRLQDSEKRDVELILLADAIGDLDKPVIVAGDLNDVAWSYTTTLFQKISNLLDPRKGRGTLGTFHAKLPFARWPLDQLFISEHFELNEIKVLPDFGSDHLPFYASLNYIAKGNNNDQIPDANQEEESEAEEIKDNKAKNYSSEEIKK